MQRDNPRNTNPIGPKGKTGLLSAISRAQDQTIRHTDLEKIFNTLLKDILILTKSNLGFIGEILFDVEGLPSLKTFAVGTIASSDEHPERYKEVSPSQRSIFPNLDTLFDSIVKKGKVLMIDKPKKGSRANGLSQNGYLHLDTFLGLPIYSRKKLIGVIGLANRPGGYDEKLIEYLQPVLKLYKEIFSLTRSNQQCRQTEVALKISKCLLKERVKEETVHLGKTNKSLEEEIVQHKQTQAILHREHDFSTALMDTLDVLVVILDNKSRIIRFNKTCEITTGYSFSEVRNRTLWECFIDHKKKVILEPMIQALMKATVSSQSYELILQAKDGTKKHIAWSNTVLRDSADCVEFIIGTGIDITERHRSEHELIENRRIMSTLMDNIPGFVYRCRNDKNWTLEFANEGFLELTGYATQDVIAGRIHYTKIVHPEDLDKIRENVQTALRLKEPFKLIYRIVTQMGPEKWVLDQGRGVFSEDGKLQHIEGFVTDMTYRKQIELQAFDRYQRLKKLTELSLTWSGDSYDAFQKIVGMVADILDVPVVFLSEVRGDKLYFSCVYENGDIIMDAGHIPLDIDPWATVIQKKDLFICNFDNVAKRFPQADILKLFNANFYCGYPSLDSDGNVVAVTGLIDDKPHHFTEEDKDLLRILGQRIATEVERKKHHAQQIKAGQTLKASEEKWRSITQYSPDQILLLDREFNIQFVNHIVSNLTMDQVIGAPMFDFISEKFKTQAKSCYEDVWKTGLPNCLETEFRDAAGKVHYFEENVGPIMADGKVTALIICARNISARKSAEEKLRQSAAVFENTAEGVFVTDSENNITAVNKAFTNITGYSEEEALGKNPRLLKPERHNRDFYSKMWSDIEKKGMWQGEIWDRRKDGEVYPTWSTITALHDNTGNLTNYISVFSDISAIKRSQEKMDFLAFHDPLTDLPNRILFNDRLENALHHAKREGSQVAVLFLDLDRFKNVNDSLGHPIGDILLKKAAKRIKQMVREEDTVARLGGDEFIIIINDVDDAQDVASLAQKLMEAFHQPMIVKGHELHLTASMGISLFPGDGQDTATLVKNADAAMYRAKEKGRNDYHFYTSKLTTDVLERLTLETALRHALDQKELILHYQPQYLLKAGKLVGAEALIRWHHPEKGLLYPAKFIPLAEDSGLIITIGEWVLTEACRQMRSWQKAGLCLDRIAVNVSSLQFQRSDIVKTVSRILEKTGLDPEHLELELTESVIMQKTDFIDILDNLKGLGVSLSIDDFGTGYSSLSYLKRLPIDKIKIDGSFVRDIPVDPNDKAITRAIIALGKSLQIKLIAEGVETEDQLAFLQSMGCDEAQGYLYSKPVIAEQFAALFETQRP